MTPRFPCPTNLFRSPAKIPNSCLALIVEVDAIVGQGTFGGALVSQGVKDEGISANFPPGGQDELTYGSVPLAPCIFMDDVIHGAETIEDARRANARMDRTVKQLNLTLNRDKTVCCVIGTLKQRREVKRELNETPLMCGEFETKLKEIKRHIQMARANFVLKRVRGLSG